MKTAKLILFFLISLMIFLVINDNFGKSSLEKYNAAPKLASQIVQDYQTNFVEPYRSKAKEPSLDSLQCPIPLEDRVKNYTKVQCVYSSIEMLGRWSGALKLINPPLTSRSECKGYSSPIQAAKVLNNLQVKFEQTYGDRKKGIELIRKAMKEGRGALWGVPGHAMVIVHYDEQENRVCWVDNSDNQLRVQQTTVDKFNQRWTSWVLVIYPDDDNLLFSKLGRNVVLPIIDHENKNNDVFVPFPN